MKDKYTESFDECKKIFAELHDMDKIKKTEEFLESLEEKEGES